MPSRSARRARCGWDQTTPDTGPWSHGHATAVAVPAHHPAALAPSDRRALGDDDVGGAVPLGPEDLPAERRLHGPIRLADGEVYGQRVEQVEPRARVVGVGRIAQREVPTQGGAEPRETPPRPGCD